MKKYELLEKAMNDYPVGTIIKWGGKKYPTTGRYFFGTGRYSNYIMYSSLGVELALYDGISWAEIIPKKAFVMKSEDGVDLYEGDEFWSVSNEKWEGEADRDYGWEIKNSNGPHKICFDSAVYKYPERNKAFSRKGSAEKFIDEQVYLNKEIYLFTKFGYNFKMTQDMGCRVTKPNGDIFNLYSMDIEKIYEAYESLKK